jgi:peptidoglycan L-alanyl-D-glutamate endopeptidase CwlK
MDSTSEARLKNVHPVLATRIVQLSDMLSFPIIVTQGLRSYAQQDALYQQGRTTPGIIVTNAKAEQSAHCFLYAVDVAPTDGHGGIDWNGKDAKWEEILAKAPSCGLAEGANFRTFPDEPHLYLQELPATPDDEMVQVLRDGGLAAVQNLIDSRLQLIP